mmetsp:Transcript_15865/g.39023  ORF Transcript_15865/g.39023 Transcript_15865/m.39023 type:complete len:215 (-) Transcript_15865:96-740(-)
MVKLRRRVCWCGCDNGGVGMSWRSAKAAALSSSRELKLAYPSLASLESKKGLGGAASASWILVALVLRAGPPDAPSAAARGAVGAEVEEARRPGACSDRRVARLPPRAPAEGPTAPLAAAAPDGALNPEPGAARAEHAPRGTVARAAAIVGPVAIIVRHRSGATVLPVALSIHERRRLRAKEAHVDYFFTVLLPQSQRSFTDGCCGCRRVSRVA